MGGSACQDNYCALAACILNPDMWSINKALAYFELDESRPQTNPRASTVLSNQAVIDGVVAAYNAREPVVQIARRYGIGTATIYQMLDARNVPRIGSGGNQAKKKVIKPENRIHIFGKEIYAQG